MSTALQGLKILDFTQMMTGPFATMLLGDSGADVIKVEQPEGDPFRRSGETTLGGDGAFFLGVNRNKRGIVLDLKSEEGRAAALELAAQADVLVENFRPGLTDKAGLGYDDLRKVNPRLVYCSISGFGRTGPDKNRPALDMIIQAVSGVMQVTGTQESGPLKTGFPFSDLVTALIATIGILVALQARERTGEGQRVDLSMLDASIFSQVPRDVYFDLTGKTPVRMGNQHWDIVPNNTYASADGRDIMIITINDKFWQILCDAIGASELKTALRTATLSMHASRRYSPVVIWLIGSSRYRPRARSMERSGPGRKCSATSMWWTRCSRPCITQRAVHSKSSTTRSSFPERLRTSCVRHRCWVSTTTRC